MASNDDYCNLTVYRVTQEQLADYFQASKRRAFISTTVNETTSIYAKDCDEHYGENLTALAQEVTRVFHCK